MSKERMLLKKNFRIVMCFYAPDGNDLSIPLASLSAYLKSKIPGIEIFLESINTTLNIPEQTVAGFARRVIRHSPDLVAFSCMSPHWYALDPYLRELKTIAPKLPIVLGGYQAILDPEETIAHPAIDFICVGDGEKPLEELINSLDHNLLSKIEGLWMKREDQIERSGAVLFQELEHAPYLDYTIFEKDGSLKGLGLSIYGPKEKFILPVVTGRGCPYYCSYCCNTILSQTYKHKGRYLRKYDCFSLIEELVLLKDRYSVDYFEFWDELFLSDMKFAYQFLTLYKERIQLPFSINSRVEMMDEKFCLTVHEAGCDTIWFGIESGSESYRNNYLNRKMTNEQILSAAENAKKFGIRRLVFNMVGMPFETLEQMRETLALNRQIQPEHFFFFSYIPLKGTPLYHLAKEKDLLLNDEDLSVNYQEGLITGKYRLNIKEHFEGPSAEEFETICREMEMFQRKNNRLDIDEKSNIESCSKVSSPLLPLQVFERYLPLSQDLGNIGHFGLFSAPDDQLEIAQTRMLDRLVQEVTSESNVLVVGCRNKALLDRLSGESFQVTAVPIGHKQASLPPEKFVGLVSVQEIPFEDFDLQAGNWDTILLHESSDRISILDLFNGAAKLLRPGGRVIVLDSFSCHRCTDDIDPQQHKDNFIAQAERCGFVLLQEKDFSQQVLPNFGLIPSHLDELVSVGLERRCRYENSLEGYFMLVLKREKEPKWQLSEIQKVDQPAVSVLFAEVFGQPLSPEFWQWKYDQGRGKAVGLWQDGKLIAHYGGLTRELLIDGQLLFASQSCDVMVAPHARGLNARRGPFFLTCATFLESFVGYGTSHPLAFGFPNERAYRLPRLLGLYTEPITRINFRRWDAHSFRPRRWRLEKFDINGPRDWADLEQLWLQMSRELKPLAVGVRDADYVRQRYLAHPQHHYDLYVIRRRWLGSPLAVLVVKVEEEQLELLDWVAPIAALPLVIAAARLLSFNAGLTSVYLLASNPVCDYLEVTGGRTEDANIMVPENGWTPSPGLAMLRGRLWLTGGDTDFH